MDRGRSISLIVIAIVILIDDQMPAGGSTLVSGRSTNCGCFRGCILHGTHRTYDQQHYGASFLPVSFTKSKSDTPGIPAGPSIPCSLSFLSFFFFFLPLFKRSRRADDDRPPPPRRPRSSYDERSSLALFFFFFFFTLLLLALLHLSVTRILSLLYTARPRKRARARSGRA